RPRGGEGEDEILIGADPRLGAESAGLLILRLQQLRDFVGEIVEKLLLVIPRLRLRGTHRQQNARDRAWEGEAPAEPHLRPQTRLGRILALPTCEVASHHLLWK